MRKQQLFSGALAGLVIVGQFGWVSVAGAARNNKQATPTAEASPAASPVESPAASPEVTPAPTASPKPKATASPSPEASVSPSPTPEPKKKSTDVGPDGCGGTIPNWVFDTTTRTWVAADKVSFSCDKASGYYLSPKYYFDKRIGWYEIVPATAVAAQPAYMITAPNVVHTVLGDLQVGSSDYQMAQALGLLTPTAGLVVSGTGAGSNNTAQVNDSDKTWVDLTNLVNVINTLQSNANSGNVTATSNTKVGDSISGAAGVIANLINLLASAWSWSSGNLNFFMQNLTGNQTGDLMLNPTQTATSGGGSLGSGVNGTGADSNNVVGADNSSSLNVKASNTGNIVNNVDVNATSGDATASKNTSAGNVATGDAVAQVNIINLINSMISSGSSFFGILNVFGNLNGDILFPTGFLNGLVPSGSSATTGSGTVAGIGTTGAGSNNQIGTNNTDASTISNTSSNAVNNNINASAASGAVNLNSNTSAGTASTGDASTNQSLFNLSNTSIFGDNAVLVIVNVLGHWVGKIMTLPGTGTSQSALLTGNATVGNTGADSNNQVNSNNSNVANIDQSSTGTITNNVNVHAQSGDATADKNTKVGDVSTGDAKATSSVANIFNTVLNVKHWFGVLVINVFGDWTGDVNHDSDAGTVTAANGTKSSSTSPLPAASQMPTSGLLALVSPAINPTSGATYSNTNNADANTAVTSKDGKVLTAAAKTDAAQATAAASEKNMSLMFIISALVMLVAGALLSIDKKLRRN